jgi:hypothetical protein
MSDGENTVPEPVPQSDPSVTENNNPPEELPSQSDNILSSPEPVAEPVQNQSEPLPQGEPQQAHSSASDPPQPEPENKQFEHSHAHDHSGQQSNHAESGNTSHQNQLPIIQDPSPVQDIQPPLTNTQPEPTTTSQVASEPVENTTSQKSEPKVTQPEVS